MANDALGLTFWEHVGELRVHLIVAFAVFGVSFGVVLTFLTPLISLLTAPLAPYAMVFLSPLGPFAFQMRVATIASLLLSLGPWGVILVHFVGSALPRSTLRWAWAVVFVAGALSALAVVATYLWLLPWSLRVLSAASVPGSQMLLTADSYLDLFALEALFTALLLQLPLVLALLALWGLVDPRWLARRRAVLYLALVVAVAVVTPTTDLISLGLAMLPATLSLEAGLLAARLIHSRRERARHVGDTMRL